MCLHKIFFVLIIIFLNSNSIAQEWPSLGHAFSSNLWAVLFPLGTTLPGWGKRRIFIPVPWVSRCLAALPLLPGSVSRQIARSQRYGLVYSILGHIRHQTLMGAGALQRVGLVGIWMLLQVLTHKNEADQKIHCTAFQGKKKNGLCFIFLSLLFIIGMCFISLSLLFKSRSLCWNSPYFLNASLARF